MLQRRLPVTKGEELGGKGEEEDYQAVVGRHVLRRLAGARNADEDELVCRVLAGLGVGGGDHLMRVSHFDVGDGVGRRKGGSRYEDASKTSQSHP